MTDDHRCYVFYNLVIHHYISILSQKTNKSCCVLMNRQYSSFNHRFKKSVIPRVLIPYLVFTCLHTYSIVCVPVVGLTKNSG